MLEIKYKSYKEMPISIYNKLVEITNNDNLEEYDKHFNIIALLTDKNVDEIFDMPLEELNGINNKLEFLNNFEYDKNKKFKNNKIIINNKPYIVIDPSSKLSVAQYVDFQQYTNTEKPDIANILSTILIPEGKTYNKDYDVFETIEDINNNLDIITAIEIQNFTTKKCAKYINHILHYLRFQMKLIKMNPITKKEKKKILKELKELTSKIGSVL